MVLSSEKNLYEILGLPESATSSEIKASYRSLARKFHPDLNGGNDFCVKKFKEISQAYEILSDSSKKRDYDILRGAQKYKNNFSSVRNAYKKENNQNVQFKHKKFAQDNDLFSNVLNDIINGFKNTSKHNSKPENGMDIYTEVQISLQESIEGTARVINILHIQTCPNCQGRPFLNGNKCQVCGGLGELNAHKRLNVKIPAGVKSGSKIRIPNEGNIGHNGGKNGDVYLTIKIKLNSQFKYEGANILYSIPITPSEAALGATIEIPSLSGKLAMKITPNTHSGQKFRLSGEGIMQNGQKGDMIVTVNIENPKTLSEEELKLYKKLQELSKENIRENLW